MIVKPSNITLDIKVRPNPILPVGSNQSFLLHKANQYTYKTTSQTLPDITLTNIFRA